MSESALSLEELETLDLSLDFDGTELLAIQYLLGGQNSRYGFKFELMGLNKADFSGSRDEEMLRNQLVKDAEQTGDLRKVTFYVEHEDSNGQIRAVQLNFYEDGHTTSSNEVTPSEYDRFVDAIYTAKSYSKYLTSLNELLEDYVQMMELSEEREWRKQSTAEAFIDISTNHLGVDKDDILGRYMHNMVLANIGIEIYGTVTEKIDNPTGSEVTGAWGGEVEDFFKTYAQYNIPNAGSREYEHVASNLSLLVSEWKDSEDYQAGGDAIGLLEFFVEEYDIQT